MGKKNLKSPIAVGSAGNSSAATANRKKMLKPKSAEKKKKKENVKLSGIRGKKRRPTSVNKKKNAKKQEIHKPKKPPTAFFYFLEDFRKGYKEQHPDVKSMRDIGKACGEKWKIMSYEEKVSYYDTATAKRAEFEKAMAEYLKGKGSGGDYGESDEYE